MENLTPIEVTAPATAEALRQKNAEFLTKHPTEDAQISYYTQLAMDVFEEFEIDGEFSFDGVRKNVAHWFANKRANMELFRKHPYWDEEAKAIVFSQTETRLVSYADACSTIENIFNYINRKTDNYSNDSVCLALYYTLGHLCGYKELETGVINDEFIKYFMREIGDRKMHKSVASSLKVGTKITKFARKCFAHWNYAGKEIDATRLVDEHEDGDRNYNSFDKLYAKFADYLSELKIKKITVVSLHFNDFMLMSNGNSWLSCHYINSHNIFHENENSYGGCYKQGCLSYALDQPSFIMYTLPSAYEGEEYWHQPKLTRMCCQYNGGVLVTGKCYPKNEDELITRYRQTLQLILSGLENIPNLWTFSRNVNRIMGLVNTHHNAAHYRDYECSDQKPTISICRNFSGDLDNVMVIGNQAYCLECGTELHYGDGKRLQCYDHRNKKVCHNCGRRIEGDEYHMIDDKYYCDDCCFYCDHHDEYEPIGYGENIIEMENGYKQTVCDYALCLYAKCSHCGKFVRTSAAVVHNRNTYGRTCFEKLVADGVIIVKIQVVKQDSYEQGDYVLIVDNTTVCTHGCNSDMMTNYPNKIARIIYVDGDSNAYGIDAGGMNSDWTWSSNCFVGKLVGAALTDDILGKRIEEVM